ncbi:hypothetical protein [Bordetella pseudohinzii]|uniref:DNA binding HTH domain-containing protein n=1 Tax=Bordetella pseudohinzii TaxID=1331258 RepID=A0A0M7E2U9_9BORD|nr:hypothetical protein [Bordetella pseudohinzii]CUI60551.1 Uncharacterised protein [Bordetella pseudohinzii]
MRETYDCALVLAPGHGTWLHDWMRGMERQSLRNGHPRLYPQEPAGDPSWLASSCLALRRFDACLLPVESATLSWVRTALAGARQQLHTPVLALARDVGAVALRDLLPLGLDDFLRPDSADELRLRIALAARRRARAQPPALEPEEAWVYDVRRGRYADAATLQEPADPAGMVDAALLDTPFGAAKARVVGHFERTYLHCSLARHEGNVTQAARAAAKHRRAFWALMRKHRIQAAPYREQAREQRPRMA